MNDLCGIEVKTLDGQGGKVTDFLIDEDEQKVQFLQIDKGGLFDDDPVLIPHKFLGSADEDETTVGVDLEKKDFALCPVPDDFMPVAKLYKQEVAKHQNLATASRRAFFGNIVPVGITTPAVSGKIVDENEIDSNLRSFNEIQGYHLNTTDGNYGFINDVLVDDQTWKVKYYIIRSSKWNPFATDFVIPKEHINDFECANLKVGTDLATDVLKDKYNISVN